MAGKIEDSQPAVTPVTCPSEAPGNVITNPSGKRIGRPPGANADKILRDAMLILDLKAKGIADELIKKTLGIRERDYERRLKALRENKLLHRQAQSVCQEIVLRLFAMRNKVASEMDNLKSREHFHRVKHGQLILETEREIFDISKQLGYWPPTVDAPLEAEKTQDKGTDKPAARDGDLEGGLPPLESLSDDQLRQQVESLTQKA